MAAVADLARRPPLVDPQSLAGVLEEIAELASQTLELQEVFDQVASSVRRLIPFEHMKVVRSLEGERVVVHATTLTFSGACVEDGGNRCWEPIPLACWSPRLRPRGDAITAIENAADELDASFPADRRILESGVRSALWEPFLVEGHFAGGLIVSSSLPRAFGAEHQQALRPIAALLGLAVEHWRIWDTEQRRQQRFDRIETLLATLAETSDFADAFERLSSGMKPILEHDLMAITELDLQQGTLRIKASAGERDMALPRHAIPLSRRESELRSDFEIVADLPAELSSDTERERLLLATGLRSWLRVPMRLSGEVKGSLSFLHREPARYGREDADVARRLADRLALTMSFARLAEAARIATEARERAARLEATVENLTQELERRGRGRVIGESAGWREVLGQVGRVASSETTVLITGESGTGKEIVASLIRQGSPRAEKPFVAVNCAALPEQLLESELFGHEKGAFTGALTTKIGRIEQAAGGTLFLDEIGEMSPLVQAKLLRVLQEREFQRLGGGRVLRADVRVVAATNRDLATAIARGEFREDLFYRLNVFAIHVPPLRERRDDVLLLADAFLEELGRSMGRPAAGISRDARDWLLTYPWPGNVRELRNAIERAILLCDGGLITHEHLPRPIARPEAAREADVAGALDASAPLPAGGVDLEEVERRFVERALRDTRGNKSKAARLLGLTRAQLYSRIQKYSLDV